MEKDVLEKLENTFTAEYLAGLNAIFYFARELDFSERYNLIYQYELECATSIENNINEKKKNFLHVFNKGNFLDNVLMSLYFLHFHDLAERIVDRYELNDVLEFLEDARTRATFDKLNNYGY
jgi:hypothetical protein